jgi:GxxExxY protein
MVELQRNMEKSVQKGEIKLANSKRKPDYQAFVKGEYPLSDITARIIAAAKEVHANLGPGFEEVFYQRALELELPDHNLVGQREVEIEVLYRGFRLGYKRVDFVIDEVMVEIKAKAALEDVDIVQALSYLRASGNKVGLLINFGGRQVEVKRLAN